MQLRTADGGRALLDLDPATGALLPNFSLHHRLSEGSVVVDELDQPSFEALVHHWRDRALAECEGSPIQWSRTGKPDVPYAAMRAGQRLTLHLSNHLDEPLLTLFVGEEPIAQLADWPEAWLREPSPEPAWHRPGAGCVEAHRRGR